MNRISNFKFQTSSLFGLFLCARDCGPVWGCAERRKFPFSIFKFEALTGGGLCVWACGSEREAQRFTDLQ